MDSEASVSGFESPILCYQLCCPRTWTFSTWVSSSENERNNYICLIGLFSSVAQLCPTLCDPMEYSMLGFPGYHQLPELTQTHVRRVSDAIQPTHPLSSPSPPAFNLSQHQDLFQWLSSSKYWSFSLSISPSSEYLGLISFRMDWLDLLAVQRTQESSPTPQFKSISSSVLSFLYSPTLTSIQDHWKNHGLTRWTFVGKIMSLLFNMLFRLVMAFLPRSKRLLISWLQSPSAVILEPPK